MQWPLDIDRLHRCVEAIQTYQRLDRAEGATTARIMMLVGDIELGDFGNLYIFVVENDVMVKHTQREVCEIIEHYGYELTHVTRDKITIGGAIQVRFLTANQFFNTHSMRGLRIARVFFDVSHHKLAQFDDEQIEYAMMVARAGGADIV